MITKVNKILFGADYYPEQWSEDVWQEDIRLMKKYNVNTVILSVFAWAKIQPEEDEYNFDWLDHFFDLLYRNDIHVILGTPTAAQPVWMSRKYTDILPVDIGGHKRKHGGRLNYCPNSSDYRRLSGNIARVMAERYGNHPALILWHIHNEYGNYCYCDQCANAFRIWLKNKYGSIEKLNESWNTLFWSHTFSHWEEIEVPSYLNEILPNALKDRDGTNFQGMAIDYKRFMSHSLLECYENEMAQVKQFSPHIPVTTNVWDVCNRLDLFEWGRSMDLVSWDNYPSNLDHYTSISFKHDVIRSLKKGNPFLLMEQTPNQQNWQHYNALKRPGVMRLLSYQTMAHGADGLLYFQYRQSIGACEKYHAAMVPHAGHENTRIGREITQMSKELVKLGDKILDARSMVKVAILMDWSTWWGVEYSSGPSVDLKYIEQLKHYYRALNENNIGVDIVSIHDDFSNYEVVIGPVLYMCGELLSEKIKAFVTNGGLFITTFFSGIVDDRDLVIPGGYPGALKDILGVWVEETDALFPEMTNEVIIESPSPLQGRYECRLICDVMHCITAGVVATYGKDYYEGSPAVTENKIGQGKAIYIGTVLSEELLRKLILQYCLEKGINPLAPYQENIEVVQREKSGKKYFFVLNHANEVKSVQLPSGIFVDLLSGLTVEGTISLGAKDVMILELFS